MSAPPKTLCLWASVVYQTLALLAAMHTAFAADIVHPAEPVFEGKPLSKWLTEYEKSWPRPEYEGNKQVQARAKDAVNNIGTNAIPWLLEELSAKEKASGDALPTNIYSGEAIKRRWLAASAFEILGESAIGAAPKLVPLLDDSQTSYFQAHASLASQFSVLQGIGVSFMKTR